MGHDIYGFNKAGDDIAYARFSMGNHNAILLYGLLEATKYYAGVSGCGRSTNLSKQHLEKAMKNYKELFNHDGSSTPNHWDQKQILEFIQQCLSTAVQEGSVKVYFG